MHILCMGTSLQSHSMCCDGGLYLPITSNLDAALRRHRSKTGARRLWADAACINQADLAEKSNQISLMSKIYLNASRVLV
jgi:hypothetical protein